MFPNRLLNHAAKQPTKLKNKIADSSKNRHMRLKLRRPKLSDFMPSHPCPQSNSCARSSVNGWDWRKWSQGAALSDRPWLIDQLGQLGQLPPSQSSILLQNSSCKGSSARTNRAKLRNLLAAAEGSELLKITQLTVFSIHILKSFVGILYTV